MKVSVGQTIKQLFSDLSDRQRDILVRRYGINRPETATLAEIGNQYKVTRERIRQLESLALNELHQNAGKTDLIKFSQLVTAYANDLGGVVADNKLISYLQERVGGDRNSIRFLLEVSGGISEHREDSNLGTFWYLSDGHRAKAVQFIDKLYQDLKARQTPMVSPQDKMAANFLLISKKFAHSPYGEFGLAEWSQIAPKNSRDWAFLALKKNGRPMHFSEIADAVTKLRGKRTNPQTVHNELIKYDDFVLVGKGTYALQEMGYLPGVAWEVIHRLLKKHGPLASRDVAKLVLEERIFKENTVFINLQNKKRFKRLPDGRYTTLA